MSTIQITQLTMVSELQPCTAATVTRWVITV